MLAPHAAAMLRYSPWPSWQASIGDETAQGAHKTALASVVHDLGEHFTESRGISPAIHAVIDVPTHHKHNKNDEEASHLRAPTAAIPDHAISKKLIGALRRKRGQLIPKQRDGARVSNYL
jgi:hypothetical protein